MLSLTRLTSLTLPLTGQHVERDLDLTPLVNLRSLSVSYTASPRSAAVIRRLVHYNLSRLRALESFAVKNGILDEHGFMTMVTGVFRRTNLHSVELDLGCIGDLTHEARSCIHGTAHSHRGNLRTLTLHLGHARPEETVAVIARSLVECFPQLECLDLRMKSLDLHTPLAPSAMMVLGWALSGRDRPLHRLSLEFTGDAAVVELTRVRPTLRRILQRAEHAWSWSVQNLSLTLHLTDHTVPNHPVTV